jgi:hypothetical protein
MRELEMLREKYAELRLLRTSALSRQQAQPRLIRLAARFPGALRELDALPLEAVDARLDALADVLAGRRTREPWMDATARFHALFRGALAAKRWQAKAPPAARRDRARFERDHDDPEILQWAGALDTIAAPPSGRLTAAILSRMSSEHACSIDEVRSLVLASRKGACPERDYSLDADAAGAAAAAAGAAGAAEGAAPELSELAAGFDSPDDALPVDDAVGAAGLAEE